MSDSRFRVGYTSGVFDLFHIGHLTLLKNAKGLCDKLIVGVTVDELVSYKNKRAVIPFEERLEIVRSIQYVDAAIPQYDMDKFEMWNKLSFDVMFVGDDWYRSDKWSQLEEKFTEVGVRYRLFPVHAGNLVYDHQPDPDGAQVRRVGCLRRLKRNPFATPASQVVDTVKGTGRSIRERGFAGNWGRAACRAEK